MEFLTQRRALMHRLSGCLFTQEEFPVGEAVRNCIVIPVKDEEKYIERCLKSLLNQEDTAGRPVPLESFEVLVLVNNSTDGTASILSQFAKSHPEFPLYVAEVSIPAPFASVGFVRKLLKDIAYHRLKGKKNAVILTTDGDTEVAKTWLSLNLSELEKGVDAVGGRIKLRPEEVESLSPATKSMYDMDDRYHMLRATVQTFIEDASHDPLPVHYQHFNGSFAITARAYGAAGGVPEVEVLEDCALYAALESWDMKTRHSPEVRVFTSARLAGRADVGLSSQLKKLELCGSGAEEYWVESAECILEMSHIKKQLRAHWEGKGIEEDFSVPEAKDLLDDLKNRVITEHYFGRFWLENTPKLEPIIKAKHPDVPLETGVQRLEQVIGELGISPDHHFSQTSIR